MLGVNPVYAQKIRDQVIELPKGPTLVLKKHGPIRLLGLVHDGGLSLHDHVRVGDKVTLRNLAPQPDRYGARLANIYLKDGRWLQGVLVSEGQARVYPDGFYDGFIRKLYLLEDVALRKRKGHWGEGRWTIAPANPPAVRPHQYAHVSGVVLDVAEVKGNIYLNFGENWRNDFTVRIRRTNIKPFRVQSFDLFALLGEKIRVRGWVIDQNGPMIDIEHPIQLQLLN